MTLRAAASAGDCSRVHLLLSQGADVNSLPPDRNSALHAAAASGCVDIVRLLLVRGARSEVSNDAGYDALHYLRSARMTLRMRT